MTEYSKEVREKAAAMANVEGYPGNLQTHDIASFPLGRALCRAVQDGALHLDRRKLFEARLAEADRRYIGATHNGWREVLTELVVSGWTPPEPVDPVAQVAREVFTEGGMHHACASLKAALAKLGLKIVKDGQ